MTWCDMFMASQSTRNIAAVCVKSEGVFTAWYGMCFMARYVPGSESMSQLTDTPAGRQGMCELGGTVRDFYSQNVL